jgi:2-polyprenyl-3-methyl-5-hydroxy-6-metoxy-1,4-benzoquinol methylase
MHERRYNGEVERLRATQRVALLEVNRVVDLCLEGIQAMNILDVGTGGGIFAEAFSKRGMNVTGIDPMVGHSERLQVFF